MTRFETIKGTKLGARFAGGGGAMWHLTEQEALNLFNLALETEVINDNNEWRVTTVEQLIKLFVEGTKAPEDHMRKNWKMKDPRKESLHLEECKGLDENGDIQTFFKR